MAETFEEWWFSDHSDEWADILTDQEFAQVGWNARQPEIDSLKAQIERYRDICSMVAADLHRTAYSPSGSPGLWAIEQALTKVGFDTPLARQALEEPHDS